MLSALSLRFVRSCVRFRRCYDKPGCARIRAANETPPKRAPRRRLSNAIARQSRYSDVNEKMKDDRRQLLNATCTLSRVLPALVAFKALEVVYVQDALPVGEVVVDDLVGLSVLLNFVKCLHL